MKTIAILNDVHDANYVVQHRAQFSEVTLISTHAAVDDYLESHGLTCTLISSFLQPQEVSKFYTEASQIYSLLSELDAEFGNILNSSLGLKKPIRFFYALYRYWGRYEYMHLLKLSAAVECLIQLHKPTKVLIFQTRRLEDSTSFFFTKLNVYNLIFNKYGVLVEKVFAPLSKLRKSNKTLSWFKLKTQNLLKNPSRIFEKMRYQTSYPILISLKKQSGFILSLNGSRSAELLPAEVVNSLSTDLALVNTTVEKMSAPVIMQKRIEEAYTFINANIGFDISSIVKIILLEDFVERFDKLLTPLINLQTFSVDIPVLGAVWTTPPGASTVNTLLVEYLLSLGVLVVGRQHGGNYGIEVSQPKHFDSDFWWCTHYLSYGFTKKDLAETSPNLQPRCEIIPVGEKVTVQPVSDKHPKIDILFPISNAVPFYKDPVRTSLHELAEFQRELLRFLNQFSGVRVAVKPFPSYNYATSAFMELLPTCKNLEILDMPFAQALEKFSFGAIVSEFPSSPLFECLKTDAEILSLTNPLLPFNATADMLLQKRVYFYDSLPQIKKGITDFLENKLPRRRNSEFAEKYLLPANPEGVKKITAEIFGIA